MEENKEYEIPKEIEEFAESIGGGWWNYRIFEHTDYWKGIDGKECSETWYDIHEVYYDGNGNIWSWTQDGMKLYFESFKDLKETIKSIKKACKHSILKVIPASDMEDETIEDTHKYIKNIKDVF